MNNEFYKVSWLSSTNVYEVNVRQYTSEGTFKAFGHHIDRLHDMGVDVLWFMPITPISIINRKGTLGSYYACSSYVDVNPEFGTLDDFKTIVDRAHSLGMKVIIDWVANHTGCDHHWTKDHQTFYKRDPNGNFYDAHGWDDVIDLDYTNHEMRLKMIDSMRFWIDRFNIDGFRCDMAMLTPVDFWMQARTSLDSDKAHFWLAELDPADNPEYMEVFDSAYTWKWMNATFNFKMNGARDISSLRSILLDYNHLMPSTTMPAWFTSNHDENSWNGTEYEKYGELVIPLFVFSSMWKGLPLVYSGQEIPNFKRLLFFDKDQLDWTSKIELHNLYKIVLSFRKINKTFNCEGLPSDVHFVTNSVSHHIISFVRASEFGQVLVIINFSEYVLNDVEIEVFNAFGNYTELFTGLTFNFSEKYHTFSVGAWGFQVWYQ